MQMNARLLPTIPLYTDIEEYPQNGFGCTIHVCKITLSRGFLSDHYCLQYHVDILSVLFADSSLNRAEMTTQ